MRRTPFFFLLLLVGLTGTAPRTAGADESGDNAAESVCRSPRNKYRSPDPGSGGRQRTPPLPTSGFLRFDTRCQENATGLTWLLACYIESGSGTRWPGMKDGRARKP